MTAKEYASNKLKECFSEQEYAERYDDMDEEYTSCTNYLAIRETSANGKIMRLPLVMEHGGI